MIFHLRTFLCKDQVSGPEGKESEGITIECKLIRFYFVQQSEDASVNGQEERMNKNIFIQGFHYQNENED